jgi:hypothetical protein
LTILASSALAAEPGTLARLFTAGVGTCIYNLKYKEKRMIINFCTLQMFGFLYILLKPCHRYPPHHVIFIVKTKSLQIEANKN